jgi:tripartite-type tricarboxylate transporter receptor subunit TctC
LGGFTLQTIARRAFIVACGVFALLPAQGWAQQPTLRIIFPYPAGGASDAVARMLAEQLQAKLGRAVIVENRAGAGGRIGAKSVVQAEPDGATLLFAPAGMITLHPHAFHNLGYDPLVDLLPISQVMQSDLALATGPGTPARSLLELIAWLRSNPAQATYGTPGVGTGPHYAISEVARLSGLDVRHVPYRGTVAALPDLLTGRLAIYMTGTPELLEQHKAGRIRILATTGARRSPAVPDVATFKEEGFNIVAPLWFAVYAPAKTPADIAKRLNECIVAAVHAADVQARIRATGYEPTGTSAEALRQIQKADFDFWGPIVKASGFKPEQQ